MNLRNLDLNLLVVLDALLDEAHVSRAAQRLGLSQPAASSALQRCREVFADDLLERTRGGMRLTPKARDLAGPLKALLADVSSIVAPAPIPLVQLRQTVRIAMADYPAIVLIGPLLRELAQSAPGIDLVIQPWHGGEFARQGLMNGSTDLAVSVIADTGLDIVRAHLLDETYRVVMRREHPATRRFTLKAWLSYPHILVSGRGEGRGAIDLALEKLGHVRRIGVVVPTFQMVPDVLAATDMIALLPSRCIPPASTHALKIYVPPVPVDGFPLHMAWHRRRKEDQGLQHVVALVKQTLTKLPGWTAQDGKRV